jgi:hypothetical protein
MAMCSESVRRISKRSALAVLGHAIQRSAIGMGDGLGRDQDGSPAGG